MKNVINKEVKKFILEYNDLNELLNFLEINFKETIEGIYNALFVLLKKYDKNHKLVDELIEILSELADIKEVEELKCFIGPTIDFQNKINDWPIKEKIKIKSPCLEIQNIFNKIQNKRNDEFLKNKFNCLEFLIFYDKNPNMLEIFLNENDYILNIRDDEKNNILDIVLKKYLQSTSKEDTEYFYRIIIIFLNSKYHQNIIDNKKNYLKNIKQSMTDYSKAKRIVDLFDNEEIINKKELEERHQIHFAFSNIILNEMKKFKAINANREDFTNQECLTIDGKNSSCIDDALYIEKNKDETYTLYIHITDIPSFVPFSSMTRKEAGLREETLYLRDINLLLYPKAICDEICSLLPYDEKNTITYIFKLDNNYKLISDSFYLTLGKIKVAHKLTYEEVDKKIKNPQNENIDRILLNLYNFAIKRKKDYIEREYTNLVYKEDNSLYSHIDDSPSTKIIYETMVLANYQIAKYFKDLNLPYIYRKINIPTPEFIEEKIKQLKILSTNIENNKEFLSKLKDSYTESIYCKYPTYYEGLNLECYSHSTSPARRYIDSLGQYIIHDLLIENNMQNQNIDMWSSLIDKAITHSNEKIKQNEIFANEYNYLSYRRILKK